MMIRLLHNLRILIYDEFRLTEQELSSVILVVKNAHEAPFIVYRYRNFWA